MQAKDEKSPTELPSDKSLDEERRNLDNASLRPASRDGSAPVEPESAASVPPITRRDGDSLGSTEVWSVIRRAFEFLPILLYFWGYWQVKDKIRVLLHHGALAFLSLGMITFIADIAVSKGALPALKFLKWTEEPLAMGLVILAGLIILLRSAHEVREQKSEHSLASAIWHLLNRDDCKTEADLFKRSLPHIAGAFDTPVHRVSIWVPSGERLVLKDHGLHEPTPIGSAVLKELPMAEGWRVGSSQMVGRGTCRASAFHSILDSRGVCSWSFLHALVFELRRGGATSGKTHATTSSSGLVELRGNRVDFNSVVLTPSVTIDCLHAFVAVPISAFRKDEKPHGVLCIDFAKTDPLRTDQVRSAAAFGVLLALDMERLSKVAAPAP